MMYADPVIKLYLVFLLPILRELNRVNKLFQLEKGSPVKLLAELMTLYRSCLEKVMRPVTFTTWSATLRYDVADPQNHLPIAAIYFGTKFHELLVTLNLHHQAVNSVKERCQAYLLTLCQELRTRLPSNVEQLESLSELSPAVMLSPRKPPLNKLPFFQLYSGVNIGVIEQQYNRIRNVRWPEREETEVEEFWLDVLNHTNAAGERDFEELAMFIISMIALPFSNAAVERVFSQMALIKSKLRNRMQQPMLDGLLQVSGYMQRNRICCNKFAPSKDMLARFTNEIYDGVVLPEDF